MSPVRAILFDFNGVLLEDETFHWRAFREILRPAGVSLGRARYNARYLVFDDRSALKAMLRDARLPRTLLEGLLRRKRRTYRHLARRLRIDAGAARLVRDVARRVPIAVVSGAARSEVEAALGRARLRSLFGAVVTAEDVKRAKPWPDGYRMALRRLGLKEGRGSVAIEDSPGGVRAARAAGLRVFGVATTFSPSALRRAGAVRVVPALHDFKMKQLLLPEGTKVRDPTVSRRRPRRRRW